jgi:putative MATE family efflux protein
MEKERKKQKLDMLNGSIWNKLPVFALPIAATGILEQLFNASDIAIVGNFAQTDKTAAVAAVGANSPIIGLILNLFIGIALGANVVIANAIGRDDRQTVQKAVHTSMVVSVIGGVLVAIIGELIAEPLLTVLNVPDDVLELALLYLRIYFLGMPVILLYNFEAAIFRSIGETKMPLIALTLSGILNVLLNLFFVIVLKMSVNGVATATVLANVVSAGILYIKLVKSDKYIKVEFKKLRIDGKVFAKIMQIGLPAGIQSAVFAVANIVIQGAINSLGTVVIAASSAAFNIEIIAYNVMNSFSQACTTFVGQNFGANKIDRCKKTLFLCLIEDAIASGTAILIVLITGKFLLSIFNNNPEVIEIGYTRLVIIFIAYIFSMLYEVMSGYLRGFGFSLVPAILTTVGVCVLRIIWINTIFPANRTFVTIMTAYPVSLATTAVLIFIALIIYRPSKRFANKGKEKM